MMKDELVSQDSAFAPSAASNQALRGPLLIVSGQVKVPNAEHPEKCSEFGLVLTGALQL